MKDLQVGDVLYSTCADAAFGRIIRVGVDDNGCHVVDIELADPSEVLHMGRDVEDGEWKSWMTGAHIEGPGKLILTNIGYRECLSRVEFQLPDGGCFSCSQAFRIVKP